MRRVPLFLSHRFIIKNEAAATILLNISENILVENHPFFIILYKLDTKYTVKNSFLIQVMQKLCAPNMFLHQLRNRISKKLQNHCNIVATQNS